MNTCRANRVAAERVEVQAVRDAGGDLRCGDDRGQRQAVADSFGHRHDVGHDTLVLEAPVVAAGAAETGLHLVCHANAACLAYRLQGTATMSRSDVCQNLQNFMAGMLAGI